MLSLPAFGTVPPSKPPRKHVDLARPTCFRGVGTRQGSETSPRKHGTPPELRERQNEDGFSTQVSGAQIGRAVPPHIALPAALREVRIETPPDRPVPLLRSLAHDAIRRFPVSAVAGRIRRRRRRPRADGDEFFEKQVRPLLVERCLQCHGDNKTKGDLKLTSRELLLKGGDRGPAVAPGKPDESLIVQAVRFTEKPKMPPTGKLDDREIQILTRWVGMGAPWPKATVLAAPVGEFRITDEQRKFWSFQPVKATEPPTVKDAAWNGSPIDRFLQAKREALGLKPVGRRTSAY